MHRNVLHKKIEKRRLFKPSKHVFSYFAKEKITAIIPTIRRIISAAVISPLAARRTIITGKTIKERISFPMLQANLIASQKKSTITANIKMMKIVLNMITTSFV